MQAVRVTSVPRNGSPGAAYHPMYFAGRNLDEVWALPGAGKSISDYPDIRFFFFEGLARRFGQLSSAWRILALATLFVRCLSLGNRSVYVHSFLFALPFCLFGRCPLVVIHGSDKKWLATRVGRFIRNRAKAVYVVGSDITVDDGLVPGLPNIFAISRFSQLSESTKRATLADDERWDVVFVLRNAAVKNPDYPLQLAKALRETEVRIVVAGLEEPEENLPDNIDYLGVISPDRLAGILTGAPVMVVPSHSEGIAKALLEGLAAGCFVVVNERISVPDALSDGVIRCRIEDFELMRHQIVSLVDRRERNVRGPQMIEAYFDDSVRILADLYGNS